MNEGVDEMKVEIWSDIACPFCYIGKTKLEEALADFPAKKQVDMEYKSYQLDPNAPLYEGRPYYDTLADKFGSVEQAKQMTENIANHAKEAGLEFNFDQMKATNTLDAHRLLHFAKAHEKALELKDQLFIAHFTDGKDIGDINVLSELAESVGLNVAETKKVLIDKTAYRDAVAFDVQEAQQFGITGVPYFIFNRKYAISGAQPKEAFLQALEKIQAEEQTTSPFETLNTDANVAACEAGNCEVPQPEEK